MPRGDVLVAFSGLEEPLDLNFQPPLMRKELFQVATQAICSLAILLTPMDMQIRTSSLGFPAISSHFTFRRAPF